MHVLIDVLISKVQQEPSERSDNFGEWGDFIGR